MENRLKEQQLYLFSDRTSSATMQANQLRLYFSSLAYVLMNELRIRALENTEFARAQGHTIRLKLLKIGAQVRLSVRRIYVSLASSYPYQQTLFQILGNLKNAYPQLCRSSITPGTVAIPWERSALGPGVAAVSGLVRWGYLCGGRDRLLELSIPDFFRKSLQSYSAGSDLPCFGPPPRSLVSPMRYLLGELGSLTFRPP
jgi:hypothetical protein